MDIYQLNRVSDRHKLKFLSLVGIEPRPPRAAHTVLSFTLAAAASEPMALPAGTEFSGQDPFGVETRFRTLEPIAITPAQATSIFVIAGQDREDLTERWKRGAHLALFGPAPRLGAELHFEFDQQLPPGEFVNLFFTFAEKHASEEERARLVQEAEERRRACGRRSRGPLCGQSPSAAPLIDRHAVQPHHSVRLVWEYFGQQNGQSVWLQLDPQRGELDDDTRAFTLSGRVRIAVPGPMAPQLGQSGKVNYGIRCRLEAGRYDASPVAVNLAINAVTAEQAVPVGKHTLIGTENIQAVSLGVGDGRPAQEMRLPEAPAQAGSFRLLLKQGSQWQEWERRSDFDASGRTDAHYRLNPTTGDVVFGDGEHGRVPPKDAEVYVAYRATRAEAGNLGPNAVRTLADSPRNRVIFGSNKKVVDARANLASISNLLPAVGGAPAESLADAEAHAIDLMETPQRAVTLSDFKRLALATPGVRLARVEARANLHPSFPCLKATGVITLIVLPYLPEARPIPSGGLVRAVAAYVGRRRVVGTRVEVVAPTYLEVAVRARVRTGSSADKARVQQKIVETLNTFLHPLRGGSDGTGWPFGRDVYRAEVLQVIDQITGVEHVLSLDLVAAAGVPQCGNVCLAPTWLVVAGKHSVEVV
jgi:predicted phage baseplate assembly protein